MAFSSCANTFPWWIEKVLPLFTMTVCVWFRGLGSLPAPFVDPAARRRRLLGGARVGRGRRAGASRYLGRQRRAAGGTRRRRPGRRPGRRSGRRSGRAGERSRERPTGRTGPRQGGGAHPRNAAGRPAPRWCTRAPRLVPSLYFCIYQVFFWLSYFFLACLGLDGLQLFIG